jgi:hypothetical protein
VSDGVTLTRDDSVRLCVPGVRGRSRGAVPRERLSTATFASIDGEMGAMMSVPGRRSAGTAAGPASADGPLSGVDADVAPRGCGAGSAAAPVVGPASGVALGCVEADEVAVGGSFAGGSFAGAPGAGAA